MAKFIDKCAECGKEFTNYDAAYRFRCSVACDVKAGLEAKKLDEEEKEKNNGVYACNGNARSVLKTDSSE